MSGKSFSPVIMIVFLLSALSWLTGCGDSGIEATSPLKSRIRLEHVALNVAEPVKMVDWYCRHLNMKIIRKGPPPVNMIFIADAGANMMLEIYHSPDEAVPDYNAMSPLNLHLAFMVDDVKIARKKLLAAGATSAQQIIVTAQGDELAMLRDPWGVPLQLVKRSRPMLPYQQRRQIRCCD